MMLHRSLERDDGRGLNEAVVDSTVSSSTQWILYQDAPQTSKIKPQAHLALEHPIR